MTDPDVAEVAGASTTGVFAGGAPDQETVDLMHDLSRMQTWAVALACRQMPGAREAMDLVQRTRAYIVERQYPAARVRQYLNTDGDKQ
jgi:hypothetical protein